MGKRIANEMENAITLSYCTFSHHTVYLLKYFFYHCSSENTYHNKKRYRGRQQDNQRYRMASAWRNAEQAIWLHRSQGTFIISASIRPNVNCIGSSKQNDYSLPLMTKGHIGDVDLSRDQSAGSWMKRPHPQLSETAVRVHPAPGELRQTARDCPTWWGVLLYTCKHFFCFSLVPAGGHCQTRDQFLPWHSMALLSCFWNARVWPYTQVYQQTSGFPPLHPALGPGASRKRIAYKLMLVNVLIWRMFWKL